MPLCGLGCHTIGNVRQTRQCEPGAGEHTRPRHRCEGREGGEAATGKVCWRKTAAEHHLPCWVLWAEVSPRLLREHARLQGQAWGEHGMQILPQELIL